MALRDLTHQTFNADDASGCQFRCKVYRTWDWGYDASGKFGRIIVEQAYIAMGLRADTLDEMKRKVAAL